jgi:hypothetical protein
MLYSHDNIVRTRDECARLLTDFGATIVGEDNGGAVLRCAVVDDSIGNGSGSQKGVRFRIEFTSLTERTFHPLSPPTAVFPPTLSKRRLGATAAGFESALVLVQEKGSVTTFRALVQRLREEWWLDNTLQTPSAFGFCGGSPATPQHERFSS